MEPRKRSLEDDADEEPARDRDASDSDADDDVQTQNRLLLAAVVEGDPKDVQRLLDEGANLSVKNRDGLTPLHLAVQQQDTFMVNRLLERGANTEATSNDGSKPLFIAAAFSTASAVLIVEDLLKFNSDVESFNQETRTTAFYQAVDADNWRVAKILLERGADVDAKNSDGQTALYSAVQRGNIRLTKLLLKHGADSKIKLEDGSTLKDFASDKPQILSLLDTDYVLQGPSMNTPQAPSQRRFTHVPALPPDQHDKLQACFGFKATIVDFYLGDRERRIQKSPSMYEVLYGDGPEAIMTKARGNKMKGENPKFRWYHLPANNIEWVEALVTRIFAENGSGKVLDEELKSNLGLNSASGRQYRTSTAHSSFMRHLCKPIMSEPKASIEDRKADHIVLFAPYLHFETFGAYQNMSRTVQAVKYPAPPRPRSRHNRPLKSSRRVNRAPPHRAPPPTEPIAVINESESEPSSVSEEEVKKEHRLKDILRGSTLAFRGLKQKVKEKSDHLVKSISGATTGVEVDLERGVLQQTRDPEQVGDEVEVKDSPVDDVRLARNVEQPTEIKEVTENEVDPKETQKPVDSPSEKLESVEQVQEFPRPQTRTLNVDGVKSPPSDSIEAKQDNQQSEISGSHPQVVENAQGAIPDPPIASVIQIQSQQTSESTGLTLPPIRSPHISFQDVLEVPLPDSASSSQHSADKITNEADPGTLNTDGQLNDDLASDNEAQAKLKPNDILRPPPKRQAVDDFFAVGQETDNSSRRSARARNIKAFDRGNPNEHLIKGYLQSSRPGDAPPLQLRRTLDQYFYTHLESTSNRDSDQVVYRYTNDERKQMEPKIFMVDQLWIWILNGDTVISCCPERWEPLETTNPTQGAVQYSTPSHQQPPEADYGFFRHSKHAGQRNRRRESTQKAPQKHPPGPEYQSDLLSGNQGEVDRHGLPQEPPPQPPGEEPSIPLGEVDALIPRASDSRNRQGSILPTDGPTPRANPDRDGNPGNAQKSRTSKKKLQSPPNPVIGWLASVSHASRPSGKKIPQDTERTQRRADREASRAFSQSPTSSSEESRLRFQADPLNVHQMVMKHLQGSARAPIKSVYELASLISDSCANVFDQYRVDKDYQFFDFFEHSIGAVIDAEARCFKAFTEAPIEIQRPRKWATFNDDPDVSDFGRDNHIEDIHVDAIFEITTETKLLVEIKDIRDELGILQLVISDQLEVMKGFSHLSVTNSGFEQTHSPSDLYSMQPNKVLESHLHRINKMEKLVEKTYQDLNHLLDLKQKQANVSEALYARQQAVESTKQAKRSLDIANQGIKLQRLAQEQAVETARQGKTVQLFTIVTIIFLPLSFMAAFFTINIDIFPLDENGKLSLGYVLKYMLSVAGAASIPFIFLALNQDRVTRWLKQSRKWAVIGFIALCAVAILLAIIWTSGLGNGIKAAITACIIALLLIGLCAHYIYILTSVARYGSTSSDVSSSLHSLIDD
ncbi:Ankyrin repeat-containing protein [Glarea lozoyensis ATCC 20868]|uniref:Ankyrin repeat-containing protein n=1 Tax=Glarea lozoyensis (strain ATCC 20868 / MF5171) TaxID=1116229 RepID=S3EEC1_GLAL2|nr:Ankyrin repeat-containing protein [Glarea lozoyensis ATCC 20868]EPE36603.1 Ankyrin repeat-containing protein [Glarea lozoyensis ATCC 20868]